MSFMERIQNVDSRIIYILLLIALSLPLLRPIGIPLQTDPMVRAVYDIIESLDPEKDRVLLSMDYSPGAGLDAEVSPVAVIQHLTQRGIKWAAISFGTTDGPMMTNRIIADLEAKGYEYGKDFANLGYMAGEENAVRLFALDCLSVPADVRGNKTDQLPVMQGIKTIKDFAFVMQFSMSTPEMWIRQVVDPMGIRFATGTVTVSVPSIVPYYNSGQVKGVMGGVSSAAQYELLCNNPGKGAALMDAQSMGHLLIIVFIVLGNIGYFVMKDKKDKAAAGQ
ncbi:MAG: hypothetical protein ACOX35_00690 [Bacillota bacterium]|jgi:hypothetical protein|nr:hypothetical protein [Candidatus Fermentithermobacillaceae bacterium]HHX10530.1 hypothetical protein [Bacillota bacterium]